jgi:hypothetical protein
VAIFIVTLSKVPAHLASGSRTAEACFASKRNSRAGDQPERAGSE